MAKLLNADWLKSLTDAQLLEKWEQTFAWTNDAEKAAQYKVHRNQYKDERDRRRTKGKQV